MPPAAFLTSAELRAAALFAEQSRTITGMPGWCLATAPTIRASMRGRFLVSTTATSEPMRGRRRRLWVKFCCVRGTAKFSAAADSGAKAEPDPARLGGACCAGGRVNRARRRAPDWQKAGLRKSRNPPLRAIHGGILRPPRCAQPASAGIYPSRRERITMPRDRAKQEQAAAKGRRRAGGRISHAS